jgi:hypothetical protein
MLVLRFWFVDIGSTPLDCGDIWVVHFVAEKFSASRGGHQAKQVKFGPPEAADHFRISRSCRANKKAALASGLCERPLGRLCALLRRLGRLSNLALRRLAGGLRSGLIRPHGDRFRICIVREHEAD